MNGINSASAPVDLPKIVHITVDEDRLAVDLEDGRTILVPIGWYPRLANGTSEERRRFRIVSSGYGIHWPDLDEDIGVAGLLFGKKSSESPQSLERWLSKRKQQRSQAAA